MSSRPAACFLRFLKRCLPALGLLGVMAIGHQSPLLGCDLLLLWSVCGWYGMSTVGQHRAALFGAVVGFLIGGGLRLGEVIPDFSLMNAFDFFVLGAVLGSLVGGVIVAARDLREEEHSPLEIGKDK